LYTKTIPLSPAKWNVGTIWTVPEYGDSNCYLQEDDEGPLCCEIEGTVTEDEDEFLGEPEEPEMMCETADPTALPDPKIQKHPLQSDFSLDGPNQTGPTFIEPDDLRVDPSALMLRWHHWLSHVSMKRIKLMTQNGQLPKSLANCQIPLCQACKYGKASRQKW
jgi:hypothetical protein